MIWQEIESAAESEDAREQRRSLVRDNSKSAMRQAGFSKVRALEITWIRTFDTEEYIACAGSPRHIAFARSGREYKSYHECDACC